MYYKPVFIFSEGHGPLLVSIPHSGTRLPNGLEKRLRSSVRHLPDTDWHVDKLYSFLRYLHVPTIKAIYSRYLVDLNRGVEPQSLYPGQFETPICPTKTFSNRNIYLNGQEPTVDEIRERVAKYWEPYHSHLEMELNRIRAKHGYAYLIDAHSIKSTIPTLFKGKLPDINLGTADDKSCCPVISAKLLKTAQQNQGFNVVLNERFKGGFITRHYGEPSNKIHAVQIELAQSAYMKEARPHSFNIDMACKLQNLLKELVSKFQSYLPNDYVRCGDFYS